MVGVCRWRHDDGVGQDTNRRRIIIIIVVVISLTHGGGGLKGPIQAVHHFPLHQWAHRKTTQNHQREQHDQIKRPLPPKILMIFKMCREAVIDSGDYGECCGGCDRTGGYGGWCLLLVYWWCLWRSVVGVVEVVCGFGGWWLWWRPRKTDPPRKTCMSNVESRR